jgi:hypothetical protein
VVLYDNTKLAVGHPRRRHSAAHPGV